MKIFTRIKFLLLSLTIFTCVNNTLAQVTITRPNGGLNISNNLSSGSTTASFTPVGDIVIQESTPGDFASNSNLQVFTVARPTQSWQFRLTGVTVEVESPNNELIDVSIIASTERIIKIQYRVPNPTTGSNKITIKGIALQSLNRTVASTQDGNIYIYNDPDDPAKGRTRGSILGIAHGDNATGSKLAPVTKVRGSAYQLLALMPGQTLNSGDNTSGKTPLTVSAQTAGNSVNVKVYATDYGWYPVASSTALSFASNDAYAVFPAGPSNLNGTVNGTDFPVQLRTATSLGDRTITVAQSTNFLAESTTTAFSVNAGVNAKLLATFPGENYIPGSPTGKSGLATAPVAGENYPVTVRSVDAFWNTVASTNNVALSATGVTNHTTPNAANLLAGLGTFDFIFRVAGEIPQVTALNNSNTFNYTQTLPAVVAAAYAKLVLILPGESYKADVNGKEGGPIPAQIAGKPFDIKVRAIDAFGNIVPVNNTISFAATNDEFAQLPANTALVNGVLDLDASTIYRKPGINRRLTATDETTSGRSSISPDFAVNIGAFEKLLIVLPGEIYTASHPNGKIGIPENREIAQSFNIEVRAVDAAYNTITTVNDLVDITTNDALAVLPASAALTNGIKSDFAVTLNTLSYAPATTTLTATRSTAGVSPYTTAAMVVVGASNGNDFFRTVVAAGKWNNSSSWESSADATTWQPSTLTPTTSSQGVTVRSGHIITISQVDTQTGAAGALLVENNAQLTLTNGRMLTIDNGSVATNDVVVEGTLLNQGGIISLNTGAIIQFAATGKYQHDFTDNSDVIPTANWLAGSTCEVIGYTTFDNDVAGSNQTFANFIWNTPALTGSPSLLSDFKTTNFTVVSTGASGALNFVSTGGTTTITGNYTQTGGNVVANKLNGTHNVFITGNFAINGGNFSLGQGTVNFTFNGINPQSISNAGASIVFRNISFFGGGLKTLTSGNFSVATTGVLTMNPNTTLNAGGNLTVLSNASSSGTIAAIPATSRINGDVNVQRFITGGTLGHRTYRMFSSPIYDNNAPTDRKYSFNQFNDDMIISGGAGFYPTPYNPASAWTYDASASGDPYVPIASLATSVAVGEGAYLFYRGDKVNNLAAKVTPPYAIPESFPMTFVGVLNQQDVSVSLKNGFNLVGNPYASSIDWNSVTISKSNLRNNIIRIWDPVSRNYASYNGDTGVPSGVNNIIPSGQGFFVQSDAGGSLTFSENAKVSIQPSQVLMSAPADDNLVVQKNIGKVAKVMAAQTENVGILAGLTPRTELRLSLKRSDLPYKIETAVILQEGRNAAYVLRDDVNYITASGEYGTQVFLASLSGDNKKLAINYLPEVKNGTNVKFDIGNQNIDGDYNLELNFNNVPSGYVVKLKDAFLGTSTTVQNGDLRSFTVDKNQAGSYGVDRFSVAFEAPATLPVTYNTAFTVSKTNQGVLGRWSTATEVNNKRFEVLRAGDDKVYQKLHTELAKGLASAYSFVDKNPLLGNNYYKLLQFDNDGTFTETLPQVINYTGSINGSAELVSVFPNPIVSNFTVKFNGDLKANKQTLKVVNATGKILLTQSISKPQLTAGHEINISGYPSGIYFIEVYENGAHRLGQMKLIKQ